MTFRHFWFKLKQSKFNKSIKNLPKMMWLKNLGDQCNLHSIVSSLPENAHETLSLLRREKKNIISYENKKQGAVLQQMFFCKRFLPSKTNKDMSG